LHRIPHRRKAHLHAGRFDRSNSFEDEREDGDDPKTYDDKGNERGNPVVAELPSATHWSSVTQPLGQRTGECPGRGLQRVAVADTTLPSGFLVHHRSQRSSRTGRSINIDTEKA